MSKQIVPEESVVSKIYLIRDRKVMLDMDLAELYGVETKQLKRAVRRNIIRFPEDFMFELDMNEIESLRCQIGTSKITGRGGSRYVPMAFTEQGVAMLSSILNTERAVLVNLHIIRVFAKMREMLTTHKKKVGDHDEQVKRIFEYLKELLNPSKETKQIGFRYGKT